jgi:hypothetical protein
MGRWLRAALAFATALASDDGPLTGVVVHAASPSAIARKTARHAQFAFITMNFKNKRNGRAQGARTRGTLLRRVRVQ